MVTNTYSTALSGLQNATQQIQASANNIANANSSTRSTPNGVVNEPYAPQSVTTQTSASGGVISNITSDSSDVRFEYNPDDINANEDGFVALPNVDYANELVDVMIANFQYQANLEVIKAEQEREESTLDILS